METLKLCIRVDNGYIIKWRVYGDETSYVLTKNPQYARFLLNCLREFHSNKPLTLEPTLLYFNGFELNEIKEV